MQTGNTSTLVQTNTDFEQYTHVVLSQSNKETKNISAKKPHTINDSFCKLKNHRNV